MKDLFIYVFFLIIFFHVSIRVYILYLFCYCEFYTFILQGEHDLLFDLLNFTVYIQIHCILINDFIISSIYYIALYPPHLPPDNRTFSININSLLKDKWSFPNRSEKIVMFDVLKFYQHVVISFRYYASKTWNELPDHFRKETSFNQFKSLINSWNGSSCHCSFCA